MLPLHYNEYWNNQGKINTNNYELFATVFQNSPIYILEFRVMEILELKIVFIEFILWNGKRPLITL